MVLQKDIEKALFEVGLQAGDEVLFHSSLKSFGQVDGGADAVIDAFLTVVGEGGTVLVPTLVQKDFAQAYKTWHMDKPSDVGYITEVFRKRDDARRSDQATHSVAAIGKRADYYTETHGQSGFRYGPYGETAFSADSPWQKLYDNNAKVAFVGVDFKAFTLKHLFEYMLVEEGLANARARGELDENTKRPCDFRAATFETRNTVGLMWPSFVGDYVLRFASERNLFRAAKCGEAEIMVVHAKEIGDLMMEDMRKSPEWWLEADEYIEVLAWMKKYVTA